VHDSTLAPPKAQAPIRNPPFAWNTRNAIDGIVLRPPNVFHSQTFVLAALHRIASHPPVGASVSYRDAIRLWSKRKEGESMMISYLATATLAVGLLAATPEPPQWESNYGKALSATRAGNSPLLVVLDEPNSKEARIEPALLSKNVVMGNEFELLRPYHLCHVDVTTKYGRKVAKAFGANRFPHVAIIDKTGSTVLFHRSGKINATEWTTALTQHKSGERSRPRVLTQVSYQPSTPAIYSSPYPVYSSPFPTSSCPNCQRRSF
jgi:hypothetical protein